MRGVFLAFEGVEGSGKSTQAERLSDRLKKLGVECILSREPGGTPIGERIRDILLDPECGSMHGLTELYLYLASRNQHVREKVLPSLESGTTVILDRFAASSVAYQGHGRHIGARVVSRLNKLATAALKPDLTILVDVPVRVGIERKRDTSLDRLERERVEFHERVRTGYLQMAKRAPKHIKLLDGTRTADELEADISRLVDEVLKQKGIL